MAQLLDKERGLVKWRNDAECVLYDGAMLRKRIDGTKDVLRRGDVFNLMFRLRGGLARDQYDKTGDRNME